MAECRHQPHRLPFHSLNDLSVSQLRINVASQRLPGLSRGRGGKFQWIVDIDDDPAGWITHGGQRSLPAAVGQERLHRRRLPPWHFRLLGQHVDLFPQLRSDYPAEVEGN